MVNSLNTGSSARYAGEDSIGCGEKNIRPGYDSAKMLGVSNIVGVLSDHVKIIGDGSEESAEQRIEVMTSERDLINSLADSNVRESTGNRKESEDVIGKIIHDVELRLKHLARY